MADNNRMVKSWLGILSVLWLAFLAAAAIYIIFVGAQQPEIVAADEETVTEETVEETDEPAVPAEDGWYTSEQADRGQEAYDQHCAQCHGQDLAGEAGQPALVGEDFLARWNTVGALYDYNRTQMPPDNPGSLEDDTYADITAYILQVNDFPAGDEELPPDQAQLEAFSLDPEAAEEEPEEAPDVEDEPEVEEEVEEAPEEEPTEGQGNLNVSVDPDDVTVHVIGPDGYAEQFSGEQTLTGLAPGLYVVTVIRDRQSAIAEVLVEAERDHTVVLVLPEPAEPEAVPEEAPEEEPEVEEEPQEVPEEEPDVEETPEEEPDAEEAPEAEEAPDEEPEEAPEEEEVEEPGEAPELEEPEAAEAWFTEEQADRGQEAYNQHCAQCHGQDLAGDGQNPALVGESFLGRWDTVWDLFDYNRTQMPLDDPGSLEDDTYADITAYILQVNEFPAGDEELPAEQAPLEEMALEPEAAEAPEEAPEEEPEEEDEVAGQGELTINLDLMEGLTAIVLGPDGYLYQAQGTTGENLMGLMPGSYAVMVTGPDHEVASNQIEVPAGQPVTGSLALEPFGGEGQEEAQEGTDFEGPEQQAGDEQTGEDEEAQDGQPEDEDGQPGQGEEGLGRQGESEQQEDNGLPHQQGMRLSQQEDTPQEAQQENDPEEEPQEEQAADFEGPEQQADDEQTGEQEDEPEADAPQGNLEIGLEPESVRLIVVGPDAYLFQSLSSTQETLRRLVPGRYVVGASGEGYRSAVDEIDVRPEETVNLSLTLQPLGSERQEEQQDPQEAEVEEAGEGPATAPDAEETQAAGEAAEEPDEPDELAVTAEEGWFTAEQIALGHTAYAQHCASCHGSALEGRTAPPLAGESFLNRWDTAWDLYDYTRSHMPQFNPGSLEDETYVNVTAYTLYVNGFSAGEEELPPDQERLEGLTIDPEMVEVEAEEEPDEAPDEEPEEAPEEEAPEGAQDKERFEGMSLEAEASQTAEEML